MNPTSLSAPTWHHRQAAHQARVDTWLGDHLERRRDGVKHPVQDFLFTYYNYRPAQLRRWHPGHGVALQDADPADFGPHYVQDEQGLLRLDTSALLGRRRATIEWISELLRATASRSPHFGCFGMHEWAMVYRQTPEETRHNLLPLRLGAAGTSTLVEELKVKCSHFDAFRFFTPAARPLNILQPTRETQADNEQPGCLHANMDVYRWAYKLAPLTSSELVADCFELAREIRTVDMRASPYDLSSFDLEPVAIEKPDGRTEYIRCQRDFAERAAVLRAQLIEVCATALAA